MTNRPGPHTNAKAACAHNPLALGRNDSTLFDTPTPTESTPCETNPRTAAPPIRHFSTPHAQPNHRPAKRIPRTAPGPFRGGPFRGQAPIIERILPPNPHFLYKWPANSASSSPEPPSTPPPAASTAAPLPLRLRQGEVPQTIRFSRRLRAGRTVT